MTFSVVARSADGNAWGVAVASKFLAVGAIVPAAENGLGAIATQASANPAYKDEGLRLLGGGSGAQATVEALVSADAERDHRQVGVVDEHGRAAAYTGEQCMPWANHLVGDGYAIQGNILAGAEVLTAMETAWRTSDPAEDLQRRLIATLSAGDQAGGDRRGRQSAALLVVSPTGGYPGTNERVNLRVDDHPEPVAELARLLDLHDLYLGEPDRASALPLEGELAAEVTQHLRDMGYADLQTWMGVENYEARAVAGHIDPLVLAKLRQAAGRNHT